MEAIKKRTATKEQKGQTFIKSVAIHMSHANRHTSPLVLDFTKKNKGLIKNIIVPAILLFGCWYLIIIAMSLL